MQATSLNGVSYSSTKRTVQRNHASDLEARGRGPQTMQQKREGSLERLRTSLAGYQRSVTQFLAEVGKGTTLAIEEARAERRNRCEAKIGNIKRMIERTEAAIERGR